MEKKKKTELRSSHRVLLVHCRKPGNKRVQHNTRQHHDTVTVVATLVARKQALVAVLVHIVAHVSI